MVKHLQKPDILCTCYQVHPENYIRYSAFPHQISGDSLTHIAGNTSVQTKTKGVVK